MRTNKLRATLKSGGIAIGTILWETRARGVLHTLAQAGMDFVFICSEHSAYNTTSTSRGCSTPDARA